MKKKQRAGWRLLGAKMVLHRLDALRREIPSVRRGTEDESVHRMRVASRRLRSALGIFEACLGKPARRWRKRVRGLTGTLGAARDLDVQTAFLESHAAALPADRSRGRDLAAGPRLLLGRLALRRVAAQREVLKALDEIEASGVLDEMRRELASILARARKGRVVPVFPLEEGWVRSTLRRGIRELLSYGRHVRHPERVDELHEMRIAAKRLRYTLEAFAPYHRGRLGDALRVSKRLQDRLGEIHDCDVWIEILPASMADEETEARRAARGPDPRPGLRELLEDRRAERERLYGKVLRYWTRLERERFWKKLLGRLESD